MESLEQRPERSPDEILSAAAATVRFALSASRSSFSTAADELPRARLLLADGQMGVIPFAGIRVDQLELDAGPITPAESAAGPLALRNRRTEVRRLHFSIDESAVERLLRTEVASGAGIESLHARLFPDHLRIYLVLSAGCALTDGQARAVLSASIDVDEGGSFVLSFYDIRMFGRLRAGVVPSQLLDLVGSRDRHVVRGGATRIELAPEALLLTAWLPAAGWKVPDLSRAQDRHVTVRGDRLYFLLSQTATPGLVSETTSTRNLAAFEYAEAERLFEPGEAMLRDGDLEGAAEAFAPYGDPETGHPFALRRLAWIRAAQASPGPGLARAAEAKRIAEGLKRRFPDDPVALETLAALSVGTLADRADAAETFEALATRCNEENDLKGRVFAELFLGELYSAPGEGQELGLARASYEAALALEPDCVAARKAVAEVYVRTGEPAKAIDAWTRVLEVIAEAPERKRFLLRIADAHLGGLNDPESAIRVYREAQDGDDPDAPTVAAWEGLARSYAAKGDAPAAIRQLERVADRCAAVGDKKGAARANFGIGELWAGPLKRPESALMRFERTLELDPLHVGALERRYRLQLERRSLPQAMQSGHRLAEALLLAALEFDGEPRIAEQDAQLAAIQVLLEVAETAARDANDPSAAAVAAGRALGIDPSSAAARDACERHFASTGDWRGLAALFGRAAEGAPPAAAYELHTRRATVLLERLDDATGAAAELVAAADVAPDAARLGVARARLVEVLRGLKRFPELRDVRVEQWKAMPPGPVRAELAVDIGRLSRELGDPAAAATWFERATEEDRERSDAFAALSELAADRGDVAGHVRALQRRAAAEKDTGMRARLRVQAAALLLESLDDAASAKTEAEAATRETRGEGDLDETEPVPPDAYRILGRAALALGDADLAARSLEEWFARAEARLAPAGGMPIPDRAAISGEISAVHARRKDDAGELRWLRVRLEADPIDARATRRAAAIARAIGPQDLAAELIEADARMTSDRAQASELFLEAGRIWEHETKSARAEAAYRHAAATVPQDETPLLALEKLMLGEGRWEEAVDVWRASADTLAGAAAAPRWRRAGILATQRLGDAEVAARCFTRLLALEPDDRHALFFLAERARASGAWPKARDLYERLAQATIDAAPAEEAQLAMRRAEAAERSGDVPAAEERYRLAASLEPVVREPWKALRRLAVAAGRHVDAVDALEQEAVRTAEVGEKAALLAEAGKLAHEKLNDLKRAASRYREALDLAPENMPALDALESILQALEDWPALIQVLRDKARLLRDGRRRSELLRRSAEIAWERMNDVERAYEDAVAARAAAPEDPRPLAFLEKMARAERRWDRLAPLLEERARALPAPPEDAAEAREALVVEAAQIRARELGEPDRAATDLERALLEGHSGKELLVLLADLQGRRGEHARLANALVLLLPHLAGAEKANALLRLARVHGDGLQDAPAALRWLSEAHAAGPDDREIALEYKQRLAAAKRWNELAALELSLAARATDPKEAAGAYRRAGVLLRDRVDDAAGAVKAFSKALIADPEDAESLAAADTLLVARGDHATRAEIFRRQIEARPHDAVSREGLLASLAAGGRWTDLETELKPFADAEPVGGPSVRRMLLAFRAAGRWKDLVRFLEGRVTAGEAAARDLLEAVFAEREDWRGLADFHLRQAEGKGGRERARAVAQAASVLRERTHDLDRSRAILRDAVAERPEDVELLEAAGEAFEAAGDMEGLRDLLVDAAGTSEGPVRARHLRRAADITKSRLGDSTRALALWGEVLAGNPDDDEAAEAAIEILAARHDWTAVVAIWMDRAERGRDPRRRLGYYKTAGGLSRTRLSDPVRAAAAFRAALVIDPGDAEAATGAEESLEAAERWDELSSLRAARAGRGGTGPERASALIAAARIARDRSGDSRKALELFRQAVAESPGEITAIDAAASLLAGLERWDELVEWMTATADALPAAEAATRRLGAAEVLLDNSVDPPGVPAARVVSILQRNLEGDQPGAALSAAVGLLESREAWDALIELYQRTLDMAGLSLRRPATLAAMGGILRDRKGELTAAIEKFRRSYELDASSGQAFSALEEWYRDKSDWDALLAIYETDAGQATEAAPKAARLAAMAEIRARELADPVGAANDYRRALEAMPGDADLARTYEDSLERAGRWEELAEALVVRAARTSAPASAAALNIRAADLFAEKTGNLERAAALYTVAKASAGSPDEPLLGLERVHRRAQAFGPLVAVLEERGTLPGPSQARARLLLEAGVIRRARLSDPEGALRDLQAAIALDPSSIETLRELREVHRAAERWAEVDETLDSEEALSQGEPDELRAALAFERGVLFRDGFQDLTRAAFHLGRAVKLAPNDAGASLALAEISEKVKAFVIARREWLRLAARADGAARIPMLQNAARCAQEEGDAAGVVELLEDAVEADPDRLDSWDALSNGYLAVRRWDEARLVLGELLARTSKAGDAARTVSIYYRLGKAERLVGQTDKAAGRLKRLLSAEPEHAGALVLLAEIHREREEWGPLAELLPRLAKAQEGSERSDTLRELGGLLEHRLGRTADAMEVFGNALRENPEDYESLWRLSELAFQNDRHDVFLAAWARLSSREDAPARKLALAFRAGEALRRTGRPQEAAREYEKALEVDSSHLPSWIALAGLLEEMREWRRAVAAYDGALRVLSGSGQADATTADREVQVLVRRGTLLAERVGDYEAAAADLKRAVERKPDDLALRFRQAGVLAKAKGRTVDAVRELQEILHRDPFRSEVYRALGEIHAGSQSIDRAFAAFSALALLEPGDVAAKAFLDANRSKIDQGMLKALEETARAQLLTHPAAKADPIRPGMVALTDVVQGLFGTPIERTGLIAVDLASGTGLARLLDSIRARLGLSALSVFVRPAAITARRASLADLVLVDVADQQPALIVDDTLVVAVPDRRGALFILGKFLERLKGGQTVYLRLGHDEIDHLAMLIRKAFDPSAGTLEVKGMPAEAVSNAIKTLRKNAPRKAKKEIEDLASAITPERLHSWVEGLRHTENRAGLLVSNDLVQAAKVVLALDPDLGKLELDAAPDRLAHLKRSEEIAEMLRYVGSDDFHDLRKSVGLTLDAAKR